MQRWATTVSFRAKAGHGSGAGPTWLRGSVLAGENGPKGHASRTPPTRGRGAPDKGKQPHTPGHPKRTGRADQPKQRNALGAVSKGVGDNNNKHPPFGPSPPRDNPGAMGSHAGWLLPAGLGLASPTLSTAKVTPARLRATGGGVCSPERGSTVAPALAGPPGLTRDAGAPTVPLDPFRGTAAPEEFARAELVLVGVLEAFTQVVD